MQSNFDVPLTFTTLWAISADNVFDDTFLIFPANRIYISCKLSLLETICMKCQILFPGEKRRKLFQNVISWNLMFSTLWAISEDNILMIRLFFFSRKQFDIWRQFAWKVKFCFLGKNKKIFQTVCRKLMLTYCTLGKKFNRQHLKYFSYFSQKTKTSLFWKKYHQFVVICGTGPEITVKVHLMGWHSHSKVHLWYI